VEGRMFNVFYRITKSRRVAKFLSYIGYRILLMYYFVARIFLKGTINMTKQEAMEKINKISKQENHKYNYKEITKERNLDLSIIVPAYNVEDYIDECIESVINQRVKYKYELIIIDDGSKDKTREKLEKYKRYENIQIVFQENKGSSAARNKGIEMSKGQYLMFLDSDDVLCDDCINKLLNVAYEKKASIVQGAFYSFYEGNKFYTNMKYREVDVSSINKPLGAPGFPWGKVYDSKLFEKVRFPLNLWHQDTVITYVIYRLCDKYVSIPEVVYGYRINKSGITFSAKKSLKSLDTYWVVEECIKIADEVGLRKDNINYELTIIHLGSIMRRRLSNLDDEILKCVFILACELVESIRPKQLDIKEESILFKDIDRAFKEKNYKLWKLASFVI